MILTKNELNDLEHNVWINGVDKNSIDGDISHILFEQTSLCNILDTSYERLVALFVGSYYVNTLDKMMPKVTDEDLLKTRDLLGE